MQAYVISGTIADTMLRQMDNALKSAKGKSAIKEFWKNSASIASTSISYETSKYRLHGQMAEEIVSKCGKRNKKRLRAQDRELMEGTKRRPHKIMMTLKTLLTVVKKKKTKKKTTKKSTISGNPGKCY
ncbi:hypothetical protein J3Q64DRAFT_1034520 [Phycomyces blakesleeanus]|uniref:Uncharacterized protein n=1 Tax=Phycomyces blakesleeanus TaxID=4837 RepID=A0ABR3BD73_PHYBL